MKPTAFFQFTKFVPAFTAMAFLVGCTAAPKPGPWRVLFDGHDTSAWRAFGGKDFPKAGWEVKDGCLHLLPGDRGGQLVTRDTFENYEFEWEWRISRRGNNGVKYLVTEARPGTPGPEYQMVDDSTTRDPRFQTAAFYEVLAPQVKTPVRPPGEWNQSRLVVNGNHVEHWLNGVKVLAYELGSAEVKAGVARSKFKDVPGFDQKIRGHILLTNHDNETWYRNLRIRELPVK
jgi:hypothetical protein